MTKIRRNRAQWAELMAQYESGSLSHEEFCDRHELAINTFKSWRYLLNKKKSKPARSSEIKMVQVCTESSPAYKPLLRFCFPNGLELKIDVGTPAAYVASLIQALS
jgi:hypothetical protein